MEEKETMNVAEESGLNFVEQEIKKDLGKTST